MLNFLYNYCCCCFRQFDKYITLSDYSIADVYSNNEAEYVKMNNPIN